MVTGEGLAIIRGVPDMNGFIAWKRMYSRFNPTTPAKAIAAMLEFMNPRRVVDVHQIPKAIDAWELKLIAMEKEFGEKPSERMKIALVMAMLPAEMQDMLFQQEDVCGGPGQGQGHRVELQREEYPDPDGHWFHA